MPMDKFEALMEKVCPEWKDAISAMVDGELAPSEHHRLWLHLQSCQKCRDYYRQLKAVQSRLRKANWAALWAKAIKENRRLRRWLFAAVLLTAIVSTAVTASLVRHFWKPTLMTPMAAIGIFRYHLHNPPEWTFNPNCPSSCQCMAEKTQVVPVRLNVPTKPNSWDWMGICDCLGVPVSIYFANIQNQPVMLLNFNTKLLPMKAEEGTTVNWDGKEIRCYIVSDAHLLLWQESNCGFALIVPYGKINPLNLISRIKVGR
ncbi:MAG: zf-HC2 domain-containing protein [Armatimonadetes bacterium]|nr:zf-HC2 domain-containing protein [Armatimonadota bacterium]MDW8029150.1 zf-HC2 domain-containing protein [Armatimonadota bacterium]